MNIETMKKIQEQMKAQPGTAAAEICRRLGVDVKAFYNASNKLKKTGQLPKQRKRRAAPVSAPFTVATVTPTMSTRNRVYVIACSPEELGAVIRGLQ